ncbi:MAG: VOC family protein [Acidimicrobiales bacterium]|nr:VOC family protein [Acidimicrobiales bacterium]
MAVTGVSHFGLCITDVDASLAFYRDVLGFRVLRQSVTTSTNVAQLLELDEITMSLTFIELDGTIIELICFDEPKPLGGGKGPFNRVGYTHLSLKIADFDAELDRLRAAGVNVLEHTISQQEPSNARFAFITDPDGNRVELFGAIDEAGRKPWEFAPTT